MTREDAIEKAYANNIFKVNKWSEDGYEFNFEPVREFLNELYDDVESRVCKNCKYLDIPTVEHLSHLRFYKKGFSMHTYFDYEVVTDDFGCIRFEPIKRR